MNTGGIWTPLSLTTPMTASKVGKHFMIQQNKHPIKTLKIWGHPNVWGHPYVWGV